MRDPASTDRRRIAKAGIAPPPFRKPRQTLEARESLQRRRFAPERAEATTEARAPSSDHGNRCTFRRETFDLFRRISTPSFSSVFPEGTPFFSVQPRTSRTTQPSPSSRSTSAITTRSPILTARCRPLGPRRSQIPSQKRMTSASMKSLPHSIHSGSLSLVNQHLPRPTLL